MCATVDGQLLHCCMQNHPDNQYAVASETRCSDKHTDRHTAASGTAAVQACCRCVATPELGAEVLHLMVHALVAATATEMSRVPCWPALVLSLLKHALSYCGHTDNMLPKVLHNRQQCKLCKTAHSIWLRYVQAVHRYSSSTVACTLIVVTQKAYDQRRQYNVP